MNTDKTTTTKVDKKDKNSRWNQTIDVSRDRKVKKKNPILRKGGSARQQCKDRKFDRLQIQSGSDDQTWDDIDRDLDLVESYLELAKKLVSTHPDFITEDQINIVESTGILVRHLWCANSLLDLVFCFANYYKLITRSNITSSDFVNSVIRSCSAVEIQAGISIDDVKHSFHGVNITQNLKNWKSFKNSVLVEKFLDIAMHATILGLYRGPKCFDPRKFTLLKQTFKRDKFFCSMGLIECVLDLIEFVSNKFYEFFVENKTLREIIMKTSTLEDWFTNVNEHIVQSDHIKNCKVLEIDLHNFLDVTRSLWVKGNDLLRFCEIEGRDKELVRHQTFKLKQLEYLILAEFSKAASRTVPFCVCLEGHSGAGKSAVANIIHNHFGKIHSKPLTGTEMYVRNPTANFWDGFSSDKWSCLCDDVACWKPDINHVDESVMDIIRMINNMPFMPDQAALEDKGKTPFLCELVMLTTNVPLMNVDNYFNYPFAAARRVPIHIRVTPKKDVILSEVADSNNKQDNISLDTKKALMNDGTYDDNWVFDVYHPIPISCAGQNGNLTPKSVRLQIDEKHKKMNMREMLNYITKSSTEHRVHQQKVTNLFKSFPTISYCDTCNLPSYMCSCIDMQVGVCDIKRELPIFVQNFLFWFFQFLIFVFDFGMYRDIWVEIQLYLCFSYIRRRLRHYQQGIRSYCMEKENIPVLTTVGLTIVGMITSLVFLYKVKSREFSQDKREIQGNILTQGVKAPQSLGETESIWKRDEIIPSALDSSPQSLALKGQSEEKIRAKLIQSTASFLFYDESRTVCYGINLVGIVYLLPNHCIPFINNSRKCRIVKGTPKSSFMDGFEFVITEGDLERYPEKDLVVCRFRCLPCGKDIRQYFIRSKCKNIPDTAEYLTITKDKKELVRKTLFSYFVDNVKLVKVGTVQGQWWSPGIVTYPGDCGMMLYRCSPLGVQILGMHQSYDREKNIANAMAIDFEFINSIDCSMEISAAEPQWGEDIRISTIKANSVLRSIDNGCIDVYGNIASKTLRRTHVDKHIMFEDIRQLGYEQDYFEPNLTTDIPWKLNLQQLVSADCYVDSKVLNIITSQMLKEWCDLVPNDSKDEIQVLPLDTVVNGVPGRRFIDSINKNSSMGFPYNKQKRLFMDELQPDDTHQHPVKFFKEIEEKFDRCCNHAINGQRNYPVFRASLKDESLPQRKIDSGKVRVFMGAPVDFTLMMRSVLLSFIRVAQMNRYIFEGAPGIETQGEDWQGLFDYFTTFGEDNCIFGDFAGFDTSMRSNFMLAAFDLIARFHKACGASDGHVRAIYSIAQDVTFPMVEYHGDLVQFYGINPSGQALTVTLNGIINCMYMRYCYYKLNPKKEIITFRDNVKLMTYGDDNGMGVSNEAYWFNHSTLTFILKDIGVKYTMADKETLSRPYINIFEADFLKRKWRWESDLDRYVAPLDIRSIIKSLMIGVKSKHLSEKQLAAQVLDSSLSEFFWHGRNIFEDWFSNLNKIVDKYDLALYLPCKHLLSWEEYVSRYERESTP